MMNIIVFGGTTEGGRLAKTLAANGRTVTLFVATEYAQGLAPEKTDYTIIAGRLNEAEMVQYLQENPCDVVVDATHPYADQATGNISRACRTTKTPYLRLLRPPSRKYSDVIYVAHVSEAVTLLQQETGAIFLAVGSKELESFTKLDDFVSRCHVRILPMAESLQKTIDLGFKNSHVICMQGPFDEATNRAMLRATHARFLITKDSGEIGGLDAKISAAMQCSCQVIVIARPEEATGFTYDALCAHLGITNHNENERAVENSFFPLFIAMKGKRILIVGGGDIAERRARILHAFGAEISIVSPTVTPSLETMVQSTDVTYVPRKYERGDIDHFRPFLVIAATDCRLTNASVAEEAATANVPVIVADRREECSCYFPAVAETKAFIAGIVSKSGDHHGVRIVAERIRHLLQENTHSSFQHFPMKVTLIGAGPGDPELMTVKGVNLLKTADVVLYDRLVGDGILAMIPATAEKICVGKHANNHPIPQEEIGKILLAKVRQGLHVVRLKGGDPFVFGRGGEELELLAENGIPFDVVPGISSAIASGIYSGIPLTHRDYSSSLHILTGHAQKEGELEIDFASLTKIKGTIVILMSVASLRKICDGFLHAGMPPDTPTAIIENITLENQRKTLGTLETIHESAQRRQVTSPAVVIIGRVCSLSEKLDWVLNQHDNR